MQAKLLQEHSVTLVDPNVAYLCHLTKLNPGCRIVDYLLGKSFPPKPISSHLANDWSLPAG